MELDRKKANILFSGEVTVKFSEVDLESMLGLHKEGTLNTPNGYHMQDIIKHILQNVRGRNINLNNTNHTDYMENGVSVVINENAPPTLLYKNESLEIPLLTSGGEHGLTTAPRSVRQEIMDGHVKFEDAEIDRKLESLDLELKF